MPAHDRGNAKLEAYLVRILAAIVKNAGGELRVKASEVDVIDERTILVKDYDSDAQELVFRCGSAFNEVYRVSPEAPLCQTMKSSLSPVSGTASIPSRPESSPSESTKEDAQRDQEIRSTQDRLMSTLKTNADLADMEKKYLQRRVAAQVREEMKRRAQSELFPNPQ